MKPCKMFTVGHRVNSLAVRIFLRVLFLVSIWRMFCFSYQEVHFKNFCLPVKTIYPLAENSIETPDMYIIRVR